MQHRLLNATCTVVPLTCCAVAVLASAGCGTTAASGTKPPPPLASTVMHIEPIVLPELVCPVTGETVTVESPSAYFECYPVFCADRASARQFASLEMKQRARLGAEQVLAQKGIANATCPVTGESLTAAASPAIFEGEVIGFASLADANQFRSLPEEKRAKLIAQWKASESPASAEEAATSEG